MKPVNVKEVIAALVAHSKGNLFAQVDAHVLTADGEEVEICLNLDDDVKPSPEKGTPNALRLEFVPCLGNTLHYEHPDYEAGLFALNGEMDLLEATISGLKERVTELSAIRERCEAKLHELESI